MQFLVQIESREQPSGDQAFLDDLSARERQRGLELVEAGVIRDIWRVAGRQPTWASGRRRMRPLHAAITSLPAFPWMVVRITALAQHPLTR